MESTKSIENHLIIADFNCESDEEIFFSKDSSTNEMYNSVSNIAAKLFDYFEFNCDEEVILIPIIRGGIPMWDAFRKLFKNPETSFIIAERDFENNEVKINFKDIASNWNNKKIIILDTIIASGITIEKVTRFLENKLDPSNKIYLTACYASPEGIDLMVSLNKFDQIAVWKVSESMDSNGYLIPLTNGDIGKKIFG